MNQGHHKQPSLPCVYYGDCYHKLVTPVDTGLLYTTLATVSDHKYEAQLCLCWQVLRLEPHCVISNRTGLPLQIMHYSSGNKVQRLGGKATGLQPSQGQQPPRTPPGLKGVVANPQQDWTSCMDVPTGTICFAHLLVAVNQMYALLPVDMRKLCQPACFHTLLQPDFLGTQSGLTHCRNLKLLPTFSRYTVAVSLCRGAGSPCSLEHKVRVPGSVPTFRAKNGRLQC